MFRRIIGAIMFITGLLGLIITLAAAILSGQVIDGVGQSIDNTLNLALESLSAAQDSLDLAKQSIADVNTTMDTVEQSAANMSKTIADTQPVVDGISQVVAQDAPKSIEAVQTAIPNMAETARIVDNTMELLSDFGFEQEIPIPFSDPLVIGFDLGIEYNPEQPFDESILLFGESLEGLPEQLRSLEGDLETTSENLGLISKDISTLSGDLGALNEGIAEIIPLMDEYKRIINEIETALTDAREQLDVQLDKVKIVVLVALLVISLTQLTPIYVGWELVRGQQMVSLEEIERIQKSRPIPRMETTAESKLLPEDKTVLETPAEEESEET